jgi:hypothetical protein
MIPNDPLYNWGWPEIAAAILICLFLTIRYFEWRKG